MEGVRMEDKDYIIEIPYSKITLRELSLFSEVDLDGDRELVLIRIKEV